MILIETSKVINIRTDTAIETIAIGMKHNNVVVKVAEIKYQQQGNKVKVI